MRSPLPSTLPFRWLKRAPLTWNRASSTEEKVPRSWSQLFISSVRVIFFGRFRAIRGAAVEIHLNSVSVAPEREGHTVTRAGDSKNFPIRVMSRSRTVTENSRRELANDSERSSTWFSSDFVQLGLPCGGWGETRRLTVKNSGDPSPEAECRGDDLHGFLP